MNWSDIEEEFGCYNVYSCSKCQEAKPSKDFFKTEDEFYKTCKECREKTKTTKSMSASWVKEFAMKHYARDDEAREEKQKAYKRFRNWAIANDKSPLTQKRFDWCMTHCGDLECETDKGKQYYSGIYFNVE